MCFACHRLPHRSSLWISNVLALFFTTIKITHICCWTPVVINVAVLVTTVELSGAHAQLGAFRWTDTVRLIRAKPCDTNFWILRSIQVGKGYCQWVCFYKWNVGIILLLRLMTHARRRHYPIENIKFSIPLIAPCSPAEWPIGHSQHFLEMTLTHHFANSVLDP